MSNKKVTVPEKQVTTKHKTSVLKAIMLMSVSAFIAMVIKNVSSNPRKNFYARHIT